MKLVWRSRHADTHQRVRSTTCCHLDETNMDITTVHRCEGLLYFLHQFSCVSLNFYSAGPVEKSAGSGAVEKSASFFSWNGFLLFVMFSLFVALSIGFCICCCHCNYCIFVNNFTFVQSPKEDLMNKSWKTCFLFLFCRKVHFGWFYGQMQVLL